MSNTVNDDCKDLANHMGGDRDAFTRLYDRHAAVIFALCRHNAANASDADDACQETFVRAFQRLHSVGDCTGFRSWLYAIARFVCSESRRGAGRRTRHEKHAMSHTALRLTTSESPESTVASRESQDMIGAALDLLPDDQRLAIHLYYLESDPVTAARLSLGLSRSGFYKMVNRARATLAASLQSTNEEIQS
ncbi:MAG: RNA polymerase sigma factor [Planctomycetota bacterium]|nr:RNA polymerase sigma factor [Planctomycetota bacterium]